MSELLRRNEADDGWENTDDMPYTSLHDGDEEAVLDGRFTVEQLRAVLDCMAGSSKPAIGRPPVYPRARELLRESAAAIADGTVTYKMLWDRLGEEGAPRPDGHQNLAIMGRNMGLTSGSRRGRPPGTTQQTTTRIRELLRTPDSYAAIQARIKEELGEEVELSTLRAQASQLRGMGLELPARPHGGIGRGS